MPQRLHDARVSVAHRRDVAARADIRHRKLRLRRFLQNRPEHDERPRVVQLARTGHRRRRRSLRRHDARVRRPECAGRWRRLPGTAREPGTPRPAQRRASPGRRPTRSRGPGDEGVGSRSKKPGDTKSVQHRRVKRCDAVGLRVVIIRRERPRDREVRRVIHRQRGRIGPRHVAKVRDERPVVIEWQQLRDLRAHDTRG